MSAQGKLFDVADHSNLGKFWEKEIDAVNDWYRQRKIADIRKVPNNWDFISEDQYRKMHGKLPKGSLAVTDDLRKMQRVKSDLDFTGGGTGFSIVFDAKATVAKLFPLSMIKTHQLQKMRERARCGIITGAFCFLGFYQRAFFVHARYLEMREMILLKQTGRRAAPGTSSISLSEFEENTTEIFKNRANGLWDYLPVLLSR